MGQELVSLHGHHRGKPADLDKQTGINTAEFLAFLEATQQKELDKLNYRKRVPEVLTKRLADTARSTPTRTTFAPTTSASRPSTRAKKPQAATISASSRRFLTALLARAKVVLSEVDEASRPCILRAADKQMIAPSLCPWEEDCGSGRCPRQCGL